MKFDQLTKNKLRNFDQTPKLTETFDQLIRSSEIRSSDRFPINLIKLGQLRLIFIFLNLSALFWELLGTIIVLIILIALL